MSVCLCWSVRETYNLIRGCLEANWATSGFQPFTLVFSCLASAVSDLERAENRREECVIEGQFNWGGLDYATFDLFPSKPNISVKPRVALMVQVLPDWLIYNIDMDCLGIAIINA